MWLYKISVVVKYMQQYLGRLLQGFAELTGLGGALDTVEIDNVTVDEYVQHQLYMSNLNGTKFSLEHALNDLFDSDLRRIEIVTTANIVNDIYTGYVIQLLHVNAGYESQGIDAGFFCANSSQMLADDYTVRIPTEIQTASPHIQYFLNMLIDPGFKYNIVLS